METDNTHQVRLKEPGFLKGKRVLLVVANFFGLHKHIVEGLEDLGAEVDYYDERPRNNFLTKALIRLHRNLLASQINRYYSRIAENTRGRDYDYVLVVKGECIAAKSLRQLRESHSNAKFVLYQWDTVTYNKQFPTIRPLFDKVMSFDPVDSKNEGMDFLPMFYTPDYASVGMSQKRREWDLMFVGTVHYDRYPLINDIARQVRVHGGKTRLYFYQQHKLMYYKMRYFDRTLGTAPIQAFHFKPMSYVRQLGLYEKSRIVLDVQKPKQNGQTLRPFEALGARRKLITTHPDIVNYDFYDPQNILVVDREQPMVPAEFIRSPYREVPQEIYDRYSVSNWLANLLS